MTHIKTQKVYSLKELSILMGLSISGAKTWIKTTLPTMYKKGQRKSYFTPKEVKLIMTEFDE